MEVISSAVSQIGFPSAVAVYLLWREGKDKERLIKALEAAAQTTRANNKKIEQLTSEVKRLCKAKAQ